MPLFFLLIFALSSTRASVHFPALNILPGPIYLLTLAVVNNRQEKNLSSCYGVHIYNEQTLQKKTYRDLLHNCYYLLCPAVTKHLFTQSTYSVFGRLFALRWSPLRWNLSCVRYSFAGRIIVKSSVWHLTYQTRFSARPLSGSPRSVTYSELKWNIGTQKEHSKREVWCVCLQARKSDTPERRIVTPESVDWLSV